jgi:hypothetical protein
LPYGQNVTAATTPERVQDKNLHDAGRAALLRRPRIQVRAAALLYQEDEDFCHAPLPNNPERFVGVGAIFARCGRFFQKILDSICKTQMNGPLDLFLSA